MSRSPLKYLSILTVLIWGGVIGVFALDTSFLDFIRSGPQPAVSGPDITYPPDNSRFQPGDPILKIQWADTSPVSHYEIEFDFSSDFATGFSLETDVPYFDLGEFMSQSEWDELSVALFIHVRSQEVDSWSDWGNTVWFSKSRSSAPEILTPGDDARYGVGDPMPVLSWTGSEYAVTYVMEFAEDVDFKISYGEFEYPDTVLDMNAGGDPAAWDPINGAFYWRVCVLEPGDVLSPFSEPHLFTKTTISKPVLDDPPDETHFPAQSSVPVFRWYPVTDAVEYQVQFAYGDTPFPEGWNYITVSDTQLALTDYGITPSIWADFYGRLRWRVAAVDGDYFHGSFSGEFEFIKVAEWRYMAYGDSITGGYGSSTWNSGFAGYPPMLRDMLRSRYGSQVQVLCEQNVSWFPGGHAYHGDWYIDDAMAYHGPTFVLIMFGTVDVVDDGAPGCEDHNCHVKDHLRNIIDQVRSYNAVPMLATLPPINPISERAYLQSDIDALNEQIRDLAVERGVQLADMAAAFSDLPLDLPAYYYQDDWAHFNDLGYNVMAETWNDVL